VWKVSQREMFMLALAFRIVACQGPRLDFSICNIAQEVFSNFQTLFKLYSLGLLSDIDVSKLTMVDIFIHIFIRKFGLRSLQKEMD
jgi:hypothetical protein